MRIVLQRVSEASVHSEGQELGRIQKGVLLLLGIGPEDGPEDVEWLCSKITRVRIFPDDQGLMNRSVSDIQGGVLVVSQFTLFASLRKGTRPSFNDAAAPEKAIPLYEAFLSRLRETAPTLTLASGRFGAMMQVQLCNDGPVTLLLDSRQKN